MGPGSWWHGLSIADGARVQSIPGAAGANAARRDPARRDRWAGYGFNWPASPLPVFPETVRAVDPYEMAA
jgi:hypothetical protein